MDYDLVILGAGAAGMMAAVAGGDTAAECGQPLRIGILEKNAQPGLKVLVCGGGRCNFTNAGSVDFLIAQFGRNGRFLAPALRHLSNDGLQEFFARLGVPSHEEHDGKVYPDSNSARSVVNALLRRLGDRHVEIVCSTPVQSVSLLPSAGFSIITPSATFTSRALILAAAGQWYAPERPQAGTRRRSCPSAGTTCRPRPE